MHHPTEDDLDPDFPPSKTQRKKDMHALQDIGEQLVELDLQRLQEIDLPETLMNALIEARSIQKHGARRRQLQYIGKLMRQIDIAPVQEKLASWQQRSVQQTARFHQLERWRERLLSDPEVITEFAQAYPAADIQLIRTLIRNTHKEQKANKPPKSFRQLFQVLQKNISDS